MSEQQLVAGASSSRQPGAIVRLAGATVPGWLRWSVTQPTYFEAATFRVEYAVSALPAANNAAWWGTQSEVLLEVLAGFPTDQASPDSSELTSLILGRVDTIEIDQVEGVLSLTGRDYAGAFIDNKLVEAYQAKRASDIVTAIAEARGVSAVVTDTTDTIGELTQREPLKLSVYQSEWDLICNLARAEGFVAYVTPAGLYWGADPATADGATPWSITWQPGQGGAPPVSNVEQLRLQRNMTVAKGVTVTVMSYSLKTGKAFTVSYPRTARGAQPGSSSPWGGPQVYTYVLRGSHSPQQAQAYAEARYREIIAHEMRITFRAPADDLLTAQTPIALSGTGTQWDQTYYSQHVTRSMDADSGEGYVMEVEAKNQAGDASPSS